ncbi:MAG: F0F1 ATP synthase subunit epsilon [Xanthobacteraceae bacterium]|nr:F0F1 ATP synthase subunit epsilon [Xanthobacteraceae bacterium]
MATFPFELVSPTRLVFSGEVEQVDVPGSEGDFGVLAGHAPFVSTLRPGILTIKDTSGAKRLYVRGGFAEVNPKGLTVLAETAVAVEEIDREEFAAAVRKAEENIAEAKDEAARWKAVEVLDQIKAVAAALTEAGAARH